jgi:hypothetical protein
MTTTQTGTTWLERLELEPKWRGLVERLLAFEASGEPKVTWQERDATVWWPRGVPSLAHEQSYRQAVRDAGAKGHVRLLGLSPLRRLPRLRAGNHWGIQAYGPCGLEGSVFEQAINRETKPPIRESLTWDRQGRLVLGEEDRPVVRFDRPRVRPGLAWPGGEQFAWVSWDAWTWVKLGLLRERTSGLLKALVVPVEPPGSEADFQPNPHLAWLLPQGVKLHAEEIREYRQIMNSLQQASWPGDEGEGVVNRPVEEYVVWDAWQEFREARLAGQKEPLWAKGRVEPLRTWLTGWELARSELPDSESVFCSVKNWRLDWLPLKYLEWLVKDRTWTKRTNTCRWRGQTLVFRSRFIEHQESLKENRNELMANAEWLLAQAEPPQEWVEDSAGNWVVSTQRAGAEDEFELEGLPTGYWEARTVNVGGWVELPSGRRIERQLQGYRDSGTSRPLGKWGATALQRHQVRLTRVGSGSDEDPRPQSWETVGYGPRDQRSRTLRAAHAEGDHWVDHGRHEPARERVPEGPRSWLSAWRRLWSTRWRLEWLVGSLREACERGLLHAPSRDRNETWWALAGVHTQEVRPPEVVETGEGKLQDASWTEAWEWCRREANWCRVALLARGVTQDETEVEGSRKLMHEVRRLMNVARAYLERRLQPSSPETVGVCWETTELKPRPRLWVREWAGELAEPRELKPLEQREPRRWSDALWGYRDADDVGDCEWARAQAKDEREYRLHSPGRRLKMLDRRARRIARRATQPPEGWLHLWGQELVTETEAEVSS